MSTMTPTGTSVQTYRLFIKASPEAIWDALTRPEWAQRYGYGGRVELDPRPGGAYRAFSSEEMQAQGAPELIIEGEVIEADAPRRLVQTWHPIWDPESAAEAVTQLTYEIEAVEDGISTLTLTHSVDGAPRVAAMVAGGSGSGGGGWSFVLSDLKTLLETGRSLKG